MKLRPLGAAPAGLVYPVPAAAPTRAADAMPAVAHAYVVGRDQDGVATRLLLPGPVARTRVPLFMPDAGGNPLRVGWISGDGRVVSERDIRAAVPSGAELVAATDSDGRVVCVTGLADRSKPSAPVVRRAASPVVRRTAAADLAHNPHELLYSGQRGRVLGVR